MTNIYWLVYKNLEKELIKLSNQVHIDDKQLDIHPAFIKYVRAVINGEINQSNHRIIGK